MNQNEAAIDIVGDTDLCTCSVQHNVAWRYWKVEYHFLLLVAQIVKHDFSRIDIRVDKNGCKRCRNNVIGMNARQDSFHDLGVIDRHDINNIVCSIADKHELRRIADIGRCRISRRDNDQSQAEQCAHISQAQDTDRLHH